jgi:hypothetical protein
MNGVEAISKKAINRKCDKGEICRHEASKRSSFLLFTRPMVFLRHNLSFPLLLLLSPMFSLSPCCLSWSIFLPTLASSILFLPQC